MDKSRKRRKKGEKRKRKEEGADRIRSTSTIRTHRTFFVFRVRGNPSLRLPSERLSFVTLAKWSVNHGEVKHFNSSHHPCRNEQSEDGRYCRISQTTLRKDSGREQGPSTNVTVSFFFFAPSLGGRRTTYFLGIRVNVHNVSRKKQSEKRKHIFSFENAQRCRRPQTRWRSGGN